MGYLQERRVGMGQTKHKGEVMRGMVGRIFRRKNEDICMYVYRHRY
jgi:hypothetical protein